MERHVPLIVANWKPETGPRTLTSPRWAGSDLTGRDLRGWGLASADLRRADLTGANLDGADLRGANLSGAILHKASLVGADLTGADLSDVEAGGCDFTRAVLSRADMRNSRLYRACFDGAKVRGVNFHRALPKSVAEQLMARAGTPAQWHEEAGSTDFLTRALPFTGEYTVYRHKDGRAQTVRDAFSWSGLIWGFLWAPLWALHRRYWTVALLSFITVNSWLIALAVGPSGGVGPEIIPLLLIGAPIVTACVCGMKANEWESSRLLRKGFNPAPPPPRRRKRTTVRGEPDSGSGHVRARESHEQGSPPS
jgi:hypothetical protein